MNKATKTGKRKKKTIIICSALVLLLVIGIASCTMMPDAAAIVTTATATRGDLQESISTSGTVSSELQKVFFAEASGKIAEVNVAAGDAVKAGDVMIAYDMEEAELQLKQASLQQSKSTAAYQSVLADNRKSQAKLSEANTNLAVLEKQLTGWNEHLKNLQNELSDHQRVTSNSLAAESYELSKKSGDLQEQLAGLDKEAPDYGEKAAMLQEELQAVTDAISYNQYQQQSVGNSDYVADLQKEIAKVQEEIAGFEKYKAEMESQKLSGESTVMDAYDKEQYEADSELSLLNYQAAEEAYYAAKQGVVAEFDGIVMDCSAVQGAMISEGMQLLTIASSQDVKITFSASRHDVEKLEVGQKAKVTISGNAYDGVVSKINRLATVNASNTPMVGVEVHITNPDDKIILGLDAKLEIYTGSTENALLIPVEAINADKEGDFLYVVENGVVVRKAILCGIASDTYTEVLEGITEADQIIISSLTGVEEGMAVTVMPEQ